MACCQIIARDRTMHISIVRWQRCMIAVTDIGVHVMVVVDMMPIVVHQPYIVCIPIGWVVSPIVRRMPCVPSRSPKPVINDRCIDIYRFDDIIGSINIFITDYLLCSFVTLYIDTCYVLENIFCQNGLQHNKMCIPIARFDNTQIVNLSVSVQVEVGDTVLWVIDLILKIFQVFCLPKHICDCLQIKVRSDVAVVGSNGNCFVCLHNCRHQQEKRQEHCC